MATLVRAPHCGSSLWSEFLSPQQRQQTNIQHLIHSLNIKLQLSREVSCDAEVIVPLPAERSSQPLTLAFVFLSFADSQNLVRELQVGPDGKRDFSSSNVQGSNYAMSSLLGGESFGRARAVQVRLETLLATEYCEDREIESTSSTPRYAPFRERVVLLEIRASHTTKARKASEQQYLTEQEVEILTLFCLERFSARVVNVMSAEAAAEVVSRHAQAHVNFGHVPYVSQGSTATTVLATVPGIRSASAARDLQQKFVSIAGIAALSERRLTDATQQAESAARIRAFFNDPPASSLNIAQSAEVVVLDSQ